MAQLRECRKKGNRRRQAIENGNVQARGEAKVEMQSAEAAKSVEMRKLGRRKMETFESQIHQRLCDGTRREAAQSLHRHFANCELFDGCELVNRADQCAEVNPQHRSTSVRPMQS